MVKQELKICIIMVQKLLYLKTKIKTKNTHGTGCTIIKCYHNIFCMWKNINKLVSFGIKYVNQSIRSNLSYGKDMDQLITLVQ